MALESLPKGAGDGIFPVTGPDNADNESASSGFTSAYASSEHGGRHREGDQRECVA